MSRNLHWKLAGISCLALLAGCGPAPEGAEWPSPPYPPLGGQGALLVTTPLDDAVAVVDVWSSLVVARLPVGALPLESEWPSDVAPSPDGRRYYVAITNDPPAAACPHHGAVQQGRWLRIPGFVEEITLGSGVRRSVQVDSRPVAVRAAPDGSAIYAVSFDPTALAPARIHEIDPETLEVRRHLNACPGAMDLALVPGSPKAVVACYASDLLALVDLETGARKVVAIGPDPAAPGQDVRYGPLSVAAHPDGRSVWVSNLTLGALTVHATDDLSELRRVQLDGDPRRGAFSPDGSAFYVAVRAVDEHVARVDTATGEVTRLALPDGSCEDIAAVVVLPRAPGLGYVLCEGLWGEGGSVLRLRLPSGAVEGEPLRIGEAPSAIAVAPEP